MQQRLDYCEELKKPIKLHVKILSEEEMVQVKLKMYNKQVTTRGSGEPSSAASISSSTKTSTFRSAKPATNTFKGLSKGRLDLLYLDPEQARLGIRHFINKCDKITYPVERERMI